jgi:hypothetical protein
MVYFPLAFFFGLALCFNECEALLLCYPGILFGFRFSS